VDASLRATSTPLKMTETLEWENHFTSNLHIQYRDQSNSIGDELLKQSKRSRASDRESENPVRSSFGRRAKIICTIGPACNTEEAMRDLMRMGMDVARLNFSHGTHDDHAANIERLRRVATEENRTICILQDLQGPKIRTGPARTLPSRRAKSMAHLL
jgi:hypothetical protein